MVAAFALAMRSLHPEPPIVTAKAPETARAMPPALPRVELSVPPGRDPVPAPVVEKRPPTREEEFSKLINTHLSGSPSHRTVALLLASNGGAENSSVELLHGLLGEGSNLHFVANLADMRALQAGGFFEELYAGNGTFLHEAAQLSHVDYILLGKLTHSFRRQPELEDLLTCDLTLSCKLVDRSGTVVQSGSFSATGPGFTEAKALAGAAENAARQLKDKMFNAIP